MGETTHGPDHAPVDTSRLTVLSGPTAVGKGTVVTELRRLYPDLWYSVSATTRPIRPGEVDGVHYHFLTSDEFDEAVDSGEMLEWAVVHGVHRYGTPRRAVVDQLAAGRAVLLELDLQGHRQVRAALPGARHVFLAPPDRVELVRRLVGRGTETEEERERRLATADVELASVAEFDEIIVNSDVTEAALALAGLLGLVRQPAR
ncbi:guanylate kinase [Georgenia sp. Z1491]|uniref:guanylate kinase n=1 Tax=Georgenia sp. Z1491 TaxID=3416707 RepID=UPI003CF1A494